MKFGRILVVFAALVLPASMGLAQVMSLANQSLQLLHYPEVRTELQLDDRQNKQVDDLQKNFGKKFRELLPKLASMNQQQRQEALQKLSDEEERGLVEALNPKQRKRLNQISLQRAGARVIIRNDISAELHLAPIQREQISKLIQKEGEKLRELYKPYQGGQKSATPADTERLRKDAERIRIATDVDLLNVLRKDQREAYKELLGEPFKLPEPRAASVPPKAAPATK